MGLDPDFPGECFSYRAIVYMALSGVCAQGGRKVMSKSCRGDMISLLPVI